jgi:hypothetical protein
MLIILQKNRLGHIFQAHPVTLIFKSKSDEESEKVFRSILPVTSQSQGCRIFLGTMYQSGEKKYAK